MKNLLLVSILSIFISSPVFAAQQEPKWNFQGKYLVVASDADMLASAYEDGELGPINGLDMLSVIPLDNQPQNFKAYEIPAGNSVAGPPAVVDLSPDGRYAYVIETWTQRPGKSDTETFGDLKHSNLLTVLDLKNPKQPKLHDKIIIKERPDSVSVSHDGKYLAISYNNEGADAKTPLGIYSLQDGRILQKSHPEILDWDPKERLISVKWHPQKHILALINETTATVRFVRIEEQNDQITLQNWGNEVSVGKAPYIGRFTDDGKHFLVNNLFWGPDIKGTWTEAPKGTIVNITLENHKQLDGSPLHSITSQVMVGPSPEGFAVSPNGRYVVSVNMERSWLPYNDPRQTWFSSLTLIDRDPETGTMKKVHTTPYYAILPEMAVFDAGSEYLAVVKFDSYDHTKSGGAVDFFRIAHDPLDPNRKMLVQTVWSVPVQHGAHDMVLVK